MLILLYCIVSYLIMFGILLEDNESLDEITSEDIIISLFSPIIVPIIIGMRINDKSHRKK